MGLLAQEQQVLPFTLVNRDRIIRLEARMDALEAKMDALGSNVDLRFEAQQTQIEDIKTILFWGFGIFMTLNIFILGFIIRDRRTAMKPAMDKSSSADEKTRSLIIAHRDYAKENPKLTEILKVHRLL